MAAGRRPARALHTPAPRTGGTARARRRPAAAAFGAIAAALAAAGCGSAGTGEHGAATAHAASTSGGRAAACLSGFYDHSARLGSTSVDVSPAPGTDTADPHTQVSFLGVPAAQIHAVTVAGTSSGSHGGRLLPYSQGDGASFVPDKPFAPDERVSVRATVGSGAGTQVSFSFSVDTPWSTAKVGGFANPTAPPADYQTFYTLPGVQAPVMTVTTPDRDPAAGDVFTSNGPGPGRYGPLIYTPQGQLVWFDQLPSGVAADNVSVQTYEGQRALTFWQGKVLALGYGLGEDIVMNSQYQVLATVRAGNGLAADLHDFQIAPHDVAYVTAYNPMRCDLASQHGPRDGVILDAAYEAIDLRTGLVRSEWHALDHVDAGESETSPPSSTPWDFFHINSVEPEPDGSVLVSARNTWAAYRIEAGSGRILWRLGGLKSSFTLGAGTKTAWQHDARMLPNGNITIFDDGSNPPQEPQSRAVQIALDMGAHTARLVSAYTHPGLPLLAASQGNMQTLPGGNAVVGYGGVPDIAEYAGDGSLRFDAHLPLDQVFYRAFRFPWSAEPPGPPAVIATLNNTAEETIVHMSWNGATGVGSWRVLAGKAPGSLAAQATVAATGFETATILPRVFGSGKASGYVAVQALDSAGHLLRTSHTVEVRTFASAFASGGH